MSTPTAGHPARKTSKSARPGGLTHGWAAFNQLELVRPADVDAYADEVARLLKSELLEVVNSRQGGIQLPTPKDLVEREVHAGGGVDDSHEHAVADSALVNAVGPSWSTRKLRNELGGVSSQAVHQRVARGTLWALPTREGTRVYPTFQFVRRHGKLLTKPKLQAMFKILQSQDPWQVAVLLNTPADELDGVSPVQWEKEGGRIGDLERLAHNLVREWSER